MSTLRRTLKPTRKAPLTSKLLGRLSQRELAKRAGLHYSYVSLVLRGKRRPSIDALSRIAKATGRDMGATYALLLDMEAERMTREKRQKKGK